MPFSKERIKEIYNIHHDKFLTPLGKKVPLKFNKNKTRAAVCFFDPLEIEISEYYFKSTLVSEADINNTLLHEIAHAIAGHSAGHGPKWKMVARKIGCDAKRCSKAFLEGKHYKYTLRCGKGCVIRRHKLTKGKLLVCRNHQKIFKTTENISNPK